MLELFVEGVACENVDHAHKVDMLFVGAKKATVVCLVEAHVVLVEELVAAALHVERV